MKTVKTIVIVAISIVIIGSICGCSNLKKEKKVDTHFTTGTEVMYSAGDDSNWAYGNQRKEFPLGEACYVRIGSTVIAEKKKGRNTDITVTYTFTGTDRCSVEISDGIAEEVQSKDTNVKIYSRKLSAKDAKKALLFSDMTQVKMLKRLTYMLLTMITFRLNMM